MKRNHKLLTALSILLLLSMLMSLVACSGSETTQKDETTAGETEAQIEWLDNLPDDLDFNGLTLTHYNGGFFVTDELDTKEVVSRAMHDRCANVEERLNIKFARYTPATPPPRIGGDADVLRQMVAGDTKEFDFFAGFGVYTVPVCIEGYLIDMNKVPEFNEIISLDSDWWAKDYTDALSIGDMCYWVLGRLGNNFESQAYCIYVNTDLYKLVAGGEDAPSIYDTVTGGKWTLDEMTRLTRDAYLDDGDGERNENDRYGFGQQADYYIDMLAICAGATYSKRDENNIPYAAVNSEINVTINEKLYDLYQTDGALRDFQHPFTEGRLLFYSECTDIAGSLRDMEDDWTMIPMPKLDEDQDKYMTTLFEGTDPVGIPVTTDESLYEAIFSAWEACSSEQLRLVRPAILDEALKNKYSRDEETKEMVDLIIETVTTDFLIVYGGSTGLNKIFSDNCYMTRDIASQLTRKDKPLNKTIDKMIASLEEVSDNQG